MGMEVGKQTRNVFPGCHSFTTVAVRLCSMSPNMLCDMTDREQCDGVEHRALFLPCLSPRGGGQPREAFTSFMLAFITQPLQ